MPTEIEIKNRANADAIFREASAYIIQGLVPPVDTRRKMDFLIGLWRVQVGG